MSHETKPTAADLRAYADSWQRLTGSANEPLICRHLRAGADAMDRADKLAAENAELAEALRPFVIGEYPNRVMPDDSCLWEIPAGRSDGVVLNATVGDSRRAAAVLAKRESVV